MGKSKKTAMRTFMDRHPGVTRLAGTETTARPSENEEFNEALLKTKRRDDLARSIIATLMAPFVSTLADNLVAYNRNAEFRGLLADFNQACADVASNKAGFNLPLAPRFKGKRRFRGATLHRGK